MRPFVSVPLLLVAVNVASAADPRDRLLKVSGVLPMQEVVQIRIDDTQPSRHLKADEVAGAVRRAIATWNAAIARIVAGDPKLADGNFKLVERKFVEPVPKREAVVVVRFDDKEATFDGKAGIDELAFTASYFTFGSDRLITYIAFNDTDKLVKRGGFSTTGEAGKNDLEIVALHEIGHALGLGHHPSTFAPPPAMAPGLRLNQEMDLPVARTLVEPDLKMLERVIRQRKLTRPEASYTCRISDRGGASVDVTFRIGINDSELVVAKDNQRATAPLTDLLSWPIGLNTAASPGFPFDHFNLVLDGKYELRAILRHRGMTGMMMCPLERTK